MRVGVRSRKGCLLVGIAVLTRVFAASAPALAYTPTLTTSGKPVRWSGRLKLDLVGNPGNADGFSADRFREAVVSGLQRWSAGSGGKIGFDYWQGTDPARYPGNSELNGISSIYFASGAGENSAAPSNVLGLTQVWYDTDTGEILETDIQLNDRSYQFTSDPRDTSGIPGGAASPFNLLRGKVYIENVITHELGHAFGLSHSGNLQSTMLFMESPEQAHLSCDELIGINAHYFGDLNGTRGAIEGRVLSRGGSPIFGAHVQAISRTRGVALAGALSDSGGHYRIEALEPGDYYIVAEPFRAGPGALPAFYEKIDTRTCDGRDFSRTFLDSGNRSAPGAPLALTAKAGARTAAPDLVAACEPNSAAAVIAATATLTPMSAPALVEGSEPAFGVVDEMAFTKPSFYRFQKTSGDLEVHAVSFSIYSPARVTLELYDSSGRAVSSAVAREQTFHGESGYVNYDAELKARSLPEDDYVLRVEPSPVPASAYPAGQVLLDTKPFVLLTGGINPPQPSLASEIPVNARCRMNENFGTYVSPPNGPPAPRQQSHGGGLCSPVQRTGERDPRDETGRFLSLVFTWSAMVAGYAFQRRRVGGHPALRAGH